MVELITEHLATWTTAQIPKKKGGRGRGRGTANQSPHGIKKLRELILELAVRGKLVPQDPSDEPASVLLEKIAKEKARLSKEGKIKKQKPLPNISSYEKPFGLPSGWEWTRFQDVSTYIQRGKGPKYADQGNVQVVSQKCIQWPGFDITKARFVDDSSLNVYQPERFLKCNDLLWNSTGTGTVGRINVLKDIETNALVADSHVTVIRPVQVSSNFLWCYIAAPGIQSRIEPEHEKSLVSGTTKQVELNTSTVQPLMVPLPPLPEQHRIGAKVDELMALCDRLEQQQNDSAATHQTLVENLLATLTTSAEQNDFNAAWQRIANHFATMFSTEQSIDQLKQTILQLAVMGKLVPQDPNDEPASLLLEKIAKKKSHLIKEGKIKKQKPLPEISEDEKPFELPGGWEWSQCQDICYKITDGEHATPRRTDSGYYLLSARNVTNEGILLNDVDFVPLDEFEKIRKRCDPNIGDILISCSGSVGRVALVDRDEAYSMVRSAAMIRPDNNLLSERYVVFALRSPYLQGQMVSRSRKSAQANLFLGAIAQLVLSIPPLSEQHRIVAKVDELLALCDTIKSRLHEAQNTQVQLADTIVQQAVA